jgi:hypothetical protein
MPLEAEGRTGFGIERAGFRIQVRFQDSDGVHRTPAIGESGVRMKGTCFSPTAFCFLPSAFCLLLTADCLLHSGFGIQEGEEQESGFRIQESE